MILILGVASAILLGFLAVVSAYQWVFALLSLLAKHSTFKRTGDGRAKFLILIPAHNEETALPHTLASIAALRYSKDLVEVVVIADRCTDSTRQVAEEAGATCFERNDGSGVKGAAIAWGIRETSRNSYQFDALVVLDADTRVDAMLLDAFSAGISRGYRVQQAFNYLSNPWETAFTRIIAVTSILKNGLFYAGKSSVGLSAMLQGTGMCMDRAIVEQYEWNAFSVGEDWEFSVSLLLAGETIHFNPDAMIYATESSGVSQASRQRLRWATGRYAVTGTGALHLIKKGLEQRSGRLLDAAATLLCPNYSTQASLALLCCVVSWYLSRHEEWMWLLTVSISILCSMAAFFVLGVLKTESPLRAIAGIPFMLIFLPWRLGIEVLGLLGFGRKKWGRSARESSTR